MHLYYVMGSGMGHLARAAAFFYTHGIDTTQIIMLCANPLAVELFPEISIINPPLELQYNQQQYSLFLKKIIQAYDIDLIYLDTFPLGILGELGDMAFDNIKFIYLARLLDWQKYKLVFSSIQYTFFKTYIFETLQQEHEHFIEQYSVAIHYGQLIYPKQDCLDLRTYFNIKNELWLIVHSQPWQEVEDLFFYAQEIAIWQQKQVDFVIITQCEILSVLPANVYFYKTKAAYMYLQQANRIFTAAGFNLLQQCANFKEKHYIMPFKRTWDLQFERAKNYKKR